jgi:hypothetical protein
LRGLIAEHEPGSGNVLLEFLADPKHKLHRKAVGTFMATWDVATPDQVDTYIQKTVTLKTTHRAKFPAKVGAMISFEAQSLDGWTGWPLRDSKTFTFNTRTTRYLDGDPYDKPFEYRYPFATVGWFRVGELAEGKHTVHAVMEYEFTQNGQKRKGEIRSKDSKFEVIAADTPDDLVAPKAEALDRKVRDLFKVRENDFDPKAFTGYQPGTLPAQGAEYEWGPQVTWQSGTGPLSGLHCPLWMMSAPLADVDLCFDVEIHDVKTGTVYAADPVVIHRGRHMGRGFIIPRNAPAFAKGRDGFVSVKVIFKPSWAIALTVPEVKSYYPGTIKSDELRMKVYQKIEPRP